ncbi:MAG: hypothetical protein ABW360_12350 [Phenylobacterium sp.]
MPPKKKASTAKTYEADRDFNELRKGDRVEMEEDHPYLLTGYMQEVKDGAAAEGDAVVGMSTTTVSESGASGANEGPAGAGAGTGSGSSS